MRITLFGRTSAEVAGGRLVANQLGGSRPRQVLEILSLDPGTPYSKDVLADLLWEGAPPHGHRATLESYVCVLRRRLGGGGDRPTPVTTTPNGYLLDPDRVAVDLSDVRAALARATVEDVLAALEPCERTLLADDPHLSWAEDARRQLDHELGAACAEAAEVATRARRWSEAQVLAARAVVAQPLSEAAWCQLMIAQWHTAGPVLALDSFRRLSDTLYAELGIGPSATTSRLHHEILADHEGREEPEADDPSGLLRQLEAAVDASARSLGVGRTSLEVRRLLEARTS